MVFDGSKLLVRRKWYMSFDLWVCAFCICFFKGERCYCFVIDYQVAHIFLVVLCEAAIVIQSKSINPFMDAATGPILSLTTNHVCLLHSLDFEICIQWSRCRNCSWLCWLLLLTLHLCRFPFHTQVLILVRSYCRLSSLVIASVDGCCLYIIIHKSMSCGTWS